MDKHIENVKGRINGFIAMCPKPVEEKITTYAAKVGVDRAYFVMGLLSIPLVLLIIVGSMTLIYDLVGFVLPMYYSMKAIESTDTSDDKQWLTYWLIFSLFKIAESFLGPILEVIPFYFIIKVLFLIWCYQYQGAKIVYDAVVRPYIVPALGIAPPAATSSAAEPKMAKKTE